MKCASILIKHLQEEENVLPYDSPRYSLKVYNIAEVKSSSAVDETPNNNSTWLKNILGAVFNVKTVDKSEKMILKCFQGK